MSLHYTGQPVDPTMLYFVVKRFHKVE